MTTWNAVVPHDVKRVEEVSTQKFGRFIIEPLESGYGLTLGTALRRMLLSSLPGAAVTSMRVSDVPHEFSAIPGVREDMTRLMLRIKQLRLILHSAGETGESARLRLEHRGEGTVTGADIMCPAEVEIVNPELELFTVDSPEAQLELEFEVRQGRGYSPAEERGRLPIGELPVDAIFSPVRRVNFDVERARVGQRANFDKLVIEIWTDGAIRPEDALSRAAKNMMQQLTLIAGGEAIISLEAGDNYTLALARNGDEEQRRRNELYEKQIEELDLSVRVFNSLKRAGITTVGDVMDNLSRGSDAMLAIRNFGEKSLDELVEKLQEKGFMERPEDEDAEGEQEESVAQLTAPQVSGILARDGAGLADTTGAVEQP